MTHGIVLQSFGFLKRGLRLCNLLFKMCQVIPWASFCFGFHLLFWCCFHKTGKFGLWFPFSYTALVWKFCQKQEAMEIWMCCCRSAELNHLQSLVQLLKAWSSSTLHCWVDVMQCRHIQTPLENQLHSKTNPPIWLHSVTVKSKKLWCMLTTRVNGSLSWALQTSPKENLTRCSGAFFKPLFLYWGRGIPVWWKKNDHFISLSEIYELWWLHFKIPVV